MYEKLMAAILAAEALALFSVVYKGFLKPLEKYKIPEENLEKIYHSFWYR